MTDTPRRLEAPSWYPEGHRQIWADTITRLTALGAQFRADPLMIDVYVCAYANHAKAAKLAAETTPVLIRNGSAVPNPALKAQREAAADLARASKNLGLDRNPMGLALADSPVSRDGRRWCDIHQRDECKHNRKDGSPCHQWRLIPGLGSCKTHAGMRLADARAKGQANLAALYATPADLEPAEALLDEVRWAAGHVRDLRAKVAELAAQDGPDGEPGSGLWWGAVEETWRDGQLAERKLKAGPHVVLRQYDTTSDRLVRAATAARTTGALEAQVNVAKALGAGVHALLTAIFNDLGLTPAQWELVPAVVPARLSEFDPERRELEAPS